MAYHCLEDKDKHTKAFEALQDCSFLPSTSFHKPFLFIQLVYSVFDFLGFSVHPLFFAST